MKRHLILAATLLALAVALVSCANDAGPTTAPTSPARQLTPRTVETAGGVTDAVGDYIDLPITDADPDLVGGSVRCDGENIVLEVHLTPASFDPDSTIINFDLDTDQDPGTGALGITIGGTDGDVLGVEYTVTINYDPLQATVYQFTGRPHHFAAIGSFPAVALADGFSASIPRSALGDAEGRINYKVTGEARLGGGAETGVLDVMPDVGLAAGTSEPCTIELSLDLRPDGSSPPINCRNPNKLITLILPGSADFHVADVDHASVRFAGAGEWHVNKRTGEVKRHEAGTGDDDYPDLVFHFRLSDTTLDCSSTEAELTGNLWDGTPFSAMVPVTMGDPSREAVTIAPTH